MKKIITVLCLIAMLFAAAGCSGKKEEGPVDVGLAEFEKKTIPG